MIRNSSEIDHIELIMAQGHRRETVNETFIGSIRTRGKEIFDISFIKSVALSPAAQLSITREFGRKWVIFRLPGSLYLSCYMQRQAKKKKYIKYSNSKFIILT